MAKYIPGKVNENGFIPKNVLGQILNIEDTEAIL